jgi:hypothetical protein
MPFRQRSLAVCLLGLVRRLIHMFENLSIYFRPIYEGSMSGVGGWGGMTGCVKRWGHSGYLPCINLDFTCIAVCKSWTALALCV